MHLLGLSDDEILAAAAALPSNAQAQEAAATVRRQRAAEAAAGALPVHIARAVSDVLHSLRTYSHRLARVYGLHFHVTECPYCKRQGPVNRRKTAARRRNASWRSEVRDTISACEINGCRMCSECEAVVLPLILQAAETAAIEVPRQLGQKLPRVVVRRWRQCRKCSGISHEGQIMFERLGVWLPVEPEQQFSGKCPRCAWHPPGDFTGKNGWIMLPSWGVFEPVRCVSSSESHEWCGCHGDHVKPGRYLHSVDVNGKVDHAITAATPASDRT